MVRTITASTPRFMLALDAITTICIIASVIAGMLAFNQRLRSGCGATVMACSWFWGFHVCTWCVWAMYTLFVHPFMWISIGLLLGGVGVVPVAATGFIVGGYWQELGNVAFFLVLIVFGHRVATWMLEH